MRSLAAICVLAVLPACLIVPDTAAHHPLIGRKVAFPAPVIDGTRSGRPDLQYWYDDGTTLFITDNWLFPAFRDRRRARWWLNGDEYCRSFTAYEDGVTDQASAENLVCYRVTIIESGAGIRFTPISGGLFNRVWTGRYLK